MQVTVRFYSYFKDLSGCASTTQKLEQPGTIQDLLSILSKRFPKLDGRDKSVLVAVGVDYQDRSYALKDGDEVSLFPPGPRRLAGVKRQLTITHQPIDEQALAAKRELSTGAGAVVSFLGYVRETEGELTISALEYESFQRMAEHQFELLFDEADKRWPIESVRLVHRLGAVKVGEPSLWVEIVAPHREEAFAACQWLINEMKRVVPIWKKPLTDSR